MNIKKNTESDAKEKTNEWPITTNRFVCFLDILGFKDLVLKEDHNIIYKKLKKISDIRTLIETYNPELKKEEDFIHFGNKKTHIVNFSDSIIIFSEGDSIKDFNLFTFTIVFLYSCILTNNFLIKGAISHGQISVNKEDQIYFGQPLINAYQLEEELNIMGIVCDNSIDKYFLDKKLDLTKNKYISQYKQLKINLKSTGMITHYCIDFRHYIASLHRDNLKDKTTQQIDDFLQKFFKDFYITVSGNPRRYIDNTLKHLKDLEDLEKI